MKNPLIPAVLISLLCVTTALWLDRPHPVVPETAPATEYSGERAMNLLRQFLAENQPHPVGSPLNRVVKQRIQAWLDEQGIVHEEQRTWGCRLKWQNCAFVENIIATVPGELDGPYVALMAHYDSVPNAPGAGDDMSGVVSILEAARAAHATGELRHPLLLIITDAEETGLHGAEAFFQKHPLASRVGVLLNVEGSGTRGASMVLRTSQDNAWYMNLFAEGAAQPSGSSLANEVFKRMPNDTDFSVAMEADIPGIDFSFAGERNHYHTPNDSPLVLDPRTVQHHGDNLYPLTLALSKSNLTELSPGNVMYLNAYGAWWQWPAAWTIPLFVAAGLLLFAASVCVGGSVLSVVLVSTVLPLLLLTLGGALVHGSLWLLGNINGATVPWPAHLWPNRLIVLSGMLLPALLVARWLAPRVALDTLLVGAWWFLWLLCLPLMLAMPAAGAMLLSPMLPAAVLLALISWLPLPAALLSTLRLATLVPAAFFMAVALLLEETQGYHLVVTMWPWVGLFVIGLLAFMRGEALKPAVTATTILLLVGLAGGLALPLYSEHRPQHLNVLYLQDSSTGAANLHIQTRGDAPQDMLEAADFIAGTTVALPWTPFPIAYVAPITTVDLPPPTLVVENSRQTDGGREVRVRVSSNREAWRVRLYLPLEAGLRRATIDGTSMPIKPYDEEQTHVSIMLYGMQNRDATLELEFSSIDPVNAILVDTTHALPKVAQALQAVRPANATPVHAGDRATVYTTIEF